jgi:hypothetical protein
MACCLLLCDARVVCSFFSCLVLVLAVARQKDSDLCTAVHQVSLARY